MYFQIALLQFTAKLQKIFILQNTKHQLNHTTYGNKNHIEAFTYVPLSELHAR